MLACERRELAEPNINTLGAARIAHVAVEAAKVGSTAGRSLCAVANKEAARATVRPTKESFLVRPRVSNCKFNS